MIGMYEVNFYRLPSTEYEGGFLGVQARVSIDTAILYRGIIGRVSLTKNYLALINALLQGSSASSCTL